MSVSEIAAVSISGLQLLLLPFQIFTYFARRTDKTRLRFLLLTLSFLLFNSAWIINLIVPFEYHFISEEVLLLIGILLGVAVYSYLSCELKIKLIGQGLRNTLLIILVIETLRQTSVNFEITDKSNLIQFLFAFLLTITTAVFSFKAFKKIFFLKNTTYPMSVSGLGVLIIASLMPIITFFVDYQLIKLFIVNLAFVFIVSAYFRHYFAQVTVENEIYQVGEYFSHLNLGERFLRIPKTSNRYNLTVREIEIGLLLLEGKTYKEIAQLSNVAETTIRSHASNIYSKTGITGAKRLAQFKDKFNLTENFLT